MLIQIQQNNTFTVRTLNDLFFLGKLKKGGSVRVNKTQITRELNVDTRTVKKYMDGYKKPTTRNRTGYLDEYYDLIKELVNDDNQRFFYKRVLWQYLKDNHGLDCAQSSFRRWIQKHEEFQNYFNGYTNRIINNEVRNCTSSHKHVLHHRNIQVSMHLLIGKKA